MDYLYVALLRSFKIERLVDLVALITFVVVAAAGGLVDPLTRQGVQVAAPTSKRPTSPGWPLSCFPPALSDTAGSLRSSFDLDAVEIVQRSAGRWEIEVAAG